MPPTSLLTPMSSNYPLLKNMGRSKTDPGGSDSESTTPVKTPISGLSFDSSKLGVVMDANGVRFYYMLLMMISFSYNIVAFIKAILTGHISVKTFNPRFVCRFYETSNPQRCHWHLCVSSKGSSSMLAKYLCHWHFWKLCFSALF